LILEFQDLGAISTDFFGIPSLDLPFSEEINILEYGMDVDFSAEQDKTLEKTDVEVSDDEIIKTKSFSLEAQNGQRLQYLAVRHSTDPDMGQHALMQAEFLNFKPDLVLYEGPENPLVDTSRDEAIQRYGGELGLARWLVVQANKNLDGGDVPVEAHSFDLTSEDWVNGFKAGGFTSDEIAIFDVARRVYREATNAIKSGQDLSVVEDSFKRQLEETSIQGNLSYELGLLPRGDGASWTFDLLKEEYQKRTGLELTFSANNENNIETSYITSLKNMFDYELTFKDEIMAKKVEDALKTHKKVLVVAGSGHAYAQKPILEKNLSSI
jgi:hypothetical protein